MRKRVQAKDVAAELLPGVSVELLKELHLLTPDGDLNADSRRKLKQVNHFLGLLKPAIEDVLARFADPVIVDCGSGKGYLGFLVHDAFLRAAGKGTVVCVEAREDLVRASEARAKRLGMTRMRFVNAAIEAAPVPERVHVLTALHACDTATDDALVLALRTNADHVALVPCCQAEVAQQLGRAEKLQPAVAALFEQAEKLGSIAGEDAALYASLLKGRGEENAGAGRSDDALADLRKARTLDPTLDGIGALIEGFENPRRLPRGSEG